MKRNGIVVILGIVLVSVAAISVAQQGDSAGATSKLGEPGDPAAPFLRKEVRLTTMDGKTRQGVVSNLAWSGSDLRGYTPYIMLIANEQDGAKTYCIPHTAIASIQLLN